MNNITDLASFKNALLHYGFSIFWKYFIQTYVHNIRPDLEPQPSCLKLDMKSNIFKIDNIGELYEIALEYTNKINKRELGKYYTPLDVSSFMAQKLIEVYSPNSIIADVCCGTGNLIISLLKHLPKKEQMSIIKNKRLYLYDLDKYAVDLAIMKICINVLPKNDIKTYRHIKSYIKCFIGNFLEDSISLPQNSIVISNPPYGKTPSNTTIWFGAETANTNEMYALFMEKILKNSSQSIIITPQSFLGSPKYACLRRILAHYGGDIFVFDNVPASIFNGKKHGIFNTNTSNSVRAAITFVHNRWVGFKTTPMLRFKSEERNLIFEDIDKLKGTTLYHNDSVWFKCPKTLESLLNIMLKEPLRLKHYITNTPNKYLLSIPKTPRYFITASSFKLNRSASFIIYAKNQDSFNILYTILNSSISYFWWRISDGGITISKDTLLNLPIFNLTPNKAQFITQQGKKLEPSSIINKLNAGKINQNVKFSNSFRRQINTVILEQLGLLHLQDKLFHIHSNSLKLVFKFWG